MAEDNLENNTISDERFAEMISEAGFTSSKEIINAFKRYYELLIEKNKVMNLTAITEYNDVIIKHFIDSLIVKKVIDDLSANGYSFKPLEECTIADIGTGAGFPGVPLKICLSEAQITLIDALNKRIKFLDELIEALELKDIKALHGRSEEIGQDAEYRENFDLVLSRAVANLSVLSEYCLPLTKVGGYFIAYKADDSEDEVKNAVNAVRLLGGEIVSVIKTSLPGTDYKRAFCIIKKIRQCPKKYPRKAGTPGKKPL